MQDHDKARRTAATRDFLQAVRALGEPDPREDRFRVALRTRLLAEAERQRHHTTIGDSSMIATVEATRRHRSGSAIPATLPRTLPARIVAVIVAGALLLTALNAYLHGQTPAAVSAQTILQHAATTLVVPATRQVVHSVSTTHTTVAPIANYDAGVGGVSGKKHPDVLIDRWTVYLPNGATLRDDNTEIGGTQLSGPVLQHSVQNGTHGIFYDATLHQTFVTTTTLTAPPSGQIIPDPYNAASLRRFILDAQQAHGPEVQLDPEQRLDGVPVYVVQVTHHLLPQPGTTTATTTRAFVITLYVAKDDYAIRHLDLSAIGVGGRILTTTAVRIVTYAIVPVASLPSSVFSTHDLAHRHS